MAIIKCKMCGGDMELTADKTFGTCEFCGSTMTLPKIDDDQRAAAFNRGNHFRRIGEFDKALAVYERIVREDDTDAEAHWCCALCRFGIEYVEDPATYEYMPTCHRASFDSFLQDVDYLAAVEHSEGMTRRQYQKDAARIAEVQRGILATSQNAEPYDVFICYKESDESGNRTRDSLFAQDIYYQLTEQGRKVFFARITLEDVVGTQYEPYIFAALNSAKVMIVVGTKPEYLNAVWVKNEWSRFLAMMKKDRHKLLLPCYRDMDPYDMPEALSVLQSYDMSKIGFIQDLTRGVAKVLDADKKPAAVKESGASQQAGGANVAPLLKRAFMFLEDRDWQNADEYCEKVLDMDPENANAYLGKLMAELQVGNAKELRDYAVPFDDRNNYQKAIRFADPKMQAALANCIKYIKTRNENARLESIYSRAMQAIENKADSESVYREAARLFESISHYKDAGAKAKECNKKADIAAKNAILAAGKSKMTADSIADYQSAIDLFEKIPGWKDADESASVCRRKIAEITDRQNAARKKAAARAKRKKTITISTISIVLAVITIVVVLNTVIIPSKNYNDAIALMNAGETLQALRKFSELDDYKDAKKYAEQLRLPWQIALGESISAGSLYTAGLKADGTVVAIYNNSLYGYIFDSFVLDWRDIVAISCASQIVGLKADGTVVVHGNDNFDMYDVSDWAGIIAISSGEYHAIGMKTDGTVVAVGDNVYGQCDVSGWDDIVAISAGSSHTVGLKADGTVVAVGDDVYGQCDVSGWDDIVAISAGSSHTVGLKADGTVVAVGDNDYGQCNVSEWKDIVTISAGQDYTVGLKADGSVIVVGDDFPGKCDISGWTDIRVPETNERNE